MRAGLIAERSRVLSPSGARRSPRLETTIIDLEKRIEADNAALVRASRNGQGKTIAALSISIHEARRRSTSSSGSWNRPPTPASPGHREFETRLEAIREGP